MAEVVGVGARPVRCWPDTSESPTMREEENEERVERRERGRSKGKRKGQKEHAEPEGA
jgi:hypothetical protein